jgi:hypothetical protein
MVYLISKPFTTPISQILKMESEFEKFTKLVLDETTDNNEENLKSEVPKNSTDDTEKNNDETNNINHIIDVTDAHTTLMDSGDLWLIQPNDIYKTNLVGLKLLVNEGDNITFNMQPYDSPLYSRTINIDEDHWKYWKLSENGLYYLMLEVDNLCFNHNPDHPYIVLIGMLGLTKTKTRQVLIVGMCFADLDFYDQSYITDTERVLTSNEKYKFLDYTKIFATDSLFTQ